ncbi:YdcF family protein [Patescibacteria group bacterium]|nr:YdcF family protein [Patescibacteria group bacterium]
MLLLKILQQFLLPSVFILLFILIGFIFLKRKKIGKFLVIVGIILYYLFSITPVSDLIISPLENKYARLEQNEFQQTNNIVLLLGGPESDVLRASEALRLYNLKLEKPLIYIAGRNFLSKQNQALKLKNYLVERGIPNKNIFLEDESKTTFESSQNIEKILGQEPFFLITSAYHLPRSMWIFEKNNTNPIPAPTDFKCEKSGYDLFDFFPKANNLKNVDSAFHEYFGILYYRFRAW